MDFQYPENRLADELRRYADAADVAGKPHWAAAMRLAAELLESSLREAMRRNGSRDGDDLHICGNCDGTGFVA